MLRSALFASLLTVAVPITIAYADTPAVPAAKSVYTTSGTDLGTLLDNPASKAVLMKYIPNLISNPQIDEACSMTLKALQSYAADQLTDDLAKIDADLAKTRAAK
jgi:hypothetical protein